MVRHTLKILHQMLQDFLSVSDHFATLRSKRLILFIPWLRNTGMTCGRVNLFTKELWLCMRELWFLPSFSSSLIAIFLGSILPFIYLGSIWKSYVKGYGAVYYNRQFHTRLSIYICLTYGSFLLWQLILVPNQISSLIKFMISLSKFSAINFL